MGRFVSERPICLVVVSRILVAIVPCFVVMVATEPSVASPSSCFCSGLISLYISDSSFSIKVFRMKQVPPEKGVTARDLNTSACFYFQGSMTFLCSGSSFFV